ncbi:MAG: hypothetical protein WCS72_18470, partial [Deltaproteobacteria bacterium]
VRPRAVVAINTGWQQSGGTVWITSVGWVSALSPTKPDLSLYAGDRLIAHMGPIPWPGFYWNTVDYPEGLQDFNIRAADGRRTDELHVVGGESFRVNRQVDLWWSSPNVPDADIWTPGASYTFSFTAQLVMADAAPPGAARLWAGDILVAELGPYPWAPVTWDATGVPEGTYPIRVEIPNYSAGSLQLHGRSSLSPFVVHVDRTRPIVTCEPPVLGTATGWSNGFFTLISNENLSARYAAVTVSLGGVLVTSEARGVDYPPRYQARVGWSVAPPFRATVVGFSGRDLAGNEPVVDCAFDVPAWLAPLGAGPITLGGEVVRASAFDLVFRTEEDSSVPQMIAAWSPIGGSTPDGKLAVALSENGAFPSVQSLGTPGARTTSVSTSSSRWIQNSSTWVTYWPARQPWLAWTEAAPGGAGVVRVASWTGSAWVKAPTGGIGHPGWSASGVLLDMDTISEASGAAVWTETDGAGFRRVAAGRLIGGTWVDVGGDLGAPAGASTSSPSLATASGGSAMSGYMSLLTAFLVTSPGGVPQVRAANAFPGTGWIPLEGVENRDPTAAASEPTAVIQVERAVAWVEAGQVLVRETDIMLGGRDFGPPTILNRDPARRARSPRGTQGHGGRYPLTVFFVEEGAAGDEIWARRWNGTTWDLLPGPVNDGVAGLVTSLDVKWDTFLGGASITWIDGDGHVFVRRENY